MRKWYRILRKLGKILHLSFQPITNLDIKQMDTFFLHSLFPFYSSCICWFFPLSFSCWGLRTCWNNWSIYLPTGQIKITYFVLFYLPGKILYLWPAESLHAGQDMNFIVSDHCSNCMRVIITSTHDCLKAFEYFNQFYNRKICPSLRKWYKI